MGRGSDDLGHGCVSREEALDSQGILVQASWALSPHEGPAAHSSPSNKNAVRQDVPAQESPGRDPAPGFSWPVAQAPLPGTHQQVRLPEGRLVLSTGCVVWTQLRPREHVLQVGSGRNTPETQVPTGWPCQQAGPAEAPGLMLTLPQSFSSS